MRRKLENLERRQQMREDEAQLGELLKQSRLLQSLRPRSLGGFTLGREDLYEGDRALLLKRNTSFLGGLGGGGLGGGGGGFGAPGVYGGMPGMQ